MKKKNHKRIKILCLKNFIYIVFVAIVSLVTVTIVSNIRNDNVKRKAEASIVYSSEQKPASMYDDKGNAIITTTYNGMEIPTVDEIDGGMFEDEDTGVSDSNYSYEDMGSVETFPTSTPESFRDATLGLCIYASNKYGAQCVSLSRSFWWSYANRDVSTCGTGMAKGMMNCADENAGDDFLVFWGNQGIKDGDWIVSDGGQYGHICMALGETNDGYVACLGENQGGRTCDKGGSATNIINFNIKNVIGYYRPKAYIKPEPTPIPVSNCVTWQVKEGDTMGGIMLSCEGVIKYGEVMNEYAKTWYSLIMNPGFSVYDGWSSKNGVGLYVDDTIEHRI